MRTDLSFARSGWIYGLDYKKVIIVAFLLRFIFAAAYDCYVNITDRDILLPDSKFYSIKGQYIALLLKGYDPAHVTNDMIPGDERSRNIFAIIARQEKGKLPVHIDESAIFSYILGAVYFVFGYFTLAARTVNIILSIASTCMIFGIAKRYFSQFTANLFLITALFLPTQFVYSITLTRGFVGMFIISLTLWVIYAKKQK